ncbi:hypothetical protein [uncultured Thalassospira sp.]|jgi:hypothetical protein|uniref:RSP_7527 family protein n=1 Tax=uncultured Thalassospira sp. TaxID=404382 RepID=UPI0030DB5887|tara:strand:- start:7486 stop:7647 length:162 start_codon:yes stop_codon:yes gene_type:complete
MRRNEGFDLVALHREAEKLRAQTMRKGFLALVRMIAGLFGSKGVPHGGHHAGV